MRICIFISEVKGLKQIKGPRGWSVLTMKSLYARYTFVTHPAFLQPTSTFPTKKKLRTYLSTYLNNLTSLWISNPSELFQVNLQKCWFF